MNIKLLTKSSLTNEEKKKINEIIELNNGVIFQEPGLNEVVSSFFKTKLIHYLIFCNNSLIAYCAGHKIKNKLLSIIELKPLYDIPYGGFISGCENYKIDNFLSILPHKNIYKYLFSSKPIINENNSKEYKSFIRMQTAVLDLSSTEDFLWNNMLDAKRRNMVRKALKEGIIIEKYHNEEGLRLFWPLLNDLHNRLGFFHLTYQYYSSILNLYLKENKAHIILAKKNNKIVSGIILIGNKNMIHNWKIANEQNGMNYGQGELLQWESIKFSKEYGAKYYDLCVVEPERLPSIARFKMGFTKTIIPFYTLSKRSLFYKIFNRVQHNIIKSK